MSGLLIKSQVHISGLLIALGAMLLSARAADAQGLSDLVGKKTGVIQQDTAGDLDLREDHRRRLR